MKRCELRAELYEAPRLNVLMAEVEMGFAGSPLGNAGQGGFGQIGDDDDGYWSSNARTGEDLEEDWY